MANDPDLGEWGEHVSVRQRAIPEAPQKHGKPGRSTQIRLSGGLTKSRCFISARIVASVHLYPETQG
jgi:hypothetical protein